MAKAALSTKAILRQTTLRQTYKILPVGTYVWDLRSTFGRHLIVSRAASGTVRQAGEKVKSPSDLLCHYAFLHCISRALLSLDLLLSCVVVCLDLIYIQSLQTIRVETTSD